MVERVYPTPTQDLVVVELESLLEVGVEFQFYNAQGALMRAERQGVVKGANRVYFDLSDMPSGMYLMQLSTNSLRNVPMKVVKF